MTNDRKQPGLPVVEVDQAFPLMTTDGVTRASTSAGSTGDQGPAVSAAIRDVLGWRPRPRDPKAFTAALSASFELSTVEDHVVAKYVPRGVAVQADLGAVTGGQASLYLRAKAAHEQITRMLDSLKPLRTDADPEDCEAYRGLVRDSVRRIVTELGREGGPRVSLVDSAFSVLTGFRPAIAPVPLRKTTGSATLMRLNAVVPAQTSPSADDPDTDPDTVSGQLGSLRDRFGLDDDHVNTVDEEKQRTSFWTLVGLVTDLHGAWNRQRTGFTLGAGNGFLGTDLVQISRLLAAASEQVDEFEAVLDSVLVSPAERQTVVLDLKTGLTLDDLVQWLRVFVTEDGPNTIRDAGRDGLVSSFTPTAVQLLLTLRERLVRTLVPCANAGCAGGCTCGSRGRVTCIPLGCCTKLPPGMYASRVKIAVSTLCGLLERLTRRAIRIGRFSGVVLLDLLAVPFETDPSLARIELRGLHLRPTHIPAFYPDIRDPANPNALVLPLQGSASGDMDTVSGIFRHAALPDALRKHLSTSGVVMAASEVPLAIVDGESGQLVQGTDVTTWPRLRRTDPPNDDDAPSKWNKIPANQSVVPQSPPDPLIAETADDCLVECDDESEDCDCGETGRARSTTSLEGAAQKAAWRRTEADRAAESAEEKVRTAQDRSEAAKHASNAAKSEEDATKSAADASAAADEVHALADGAAAANRRNAKKLAEFAVASADAADQAAREASAATTAAEKAKAAAEQADKAAAKKAAEDAHKAATAAAKAAVDADKAARAAKGA